MSLDHAVVARFLEELRVSGTLTASTVEHYGHDLRLFVRYFRKNAPGVVFPGDVTRTIIENYLDHTIYDRGNKRSSMRRRLVSIKKFFAFCRAQGLIDVNPTAEVEIDLSRESATRVLLTRDQALRLLEVAKTTRFPERDHAIFYLFLTCGCTLSEVINLGRRDVHLSAGTITVRRRGNRRSLPLSPGCRLALSDYLVVRPKAPAHSRLFLNRHGNPITKGAIYHAFQTIVYRAGIDKRGFNVRSLRHTCFHMLRQADVSLHVLQKLAGHKSISSTRIYQLAGRQTELKPRPAHPWVHPLDEAPQPPHEIRPPASEEDLGLAAVGGTH